MNARRALILAVVALSACRSEPEPASVVLAALPTRPEATRDGIVRLDVPSDLVVTVQQRSLLATSADGSFRLFVEHRPEESLTAVLGVLKEELIGLGWEPVEEQHFENATLVQMARGPKQHRLLRHSWIIHSNGRVALCEAIASDVQVVRLGVPLRQLCQQLRLLPEGAPRP